MTCVIILTRARGSDPYWHRSRAEKVFDETTQRVMRSNGEEKLILPLEMVGRLAVVIGYLIINNELTRMSIIIPRAKRGECGNENRHSAAQGFRRRARI